MPFYPGPGIGGHCIPIDPLYLSWKAEQQGHNTEFIKLASKINQSMTDFICSKLQKSLDLPSFDEIKNKNILILGVAYKKNVKDQRESPAFPVIKKLLGAGAVVNFHDPYIEKILPARQYPEFKDMASCSLNSASIAKQDAVIIITDHDNVDYDLVGANARLIIDTRNVFQSRKINSKALVVKA
jgi:UDP-N-acetyl-D-glucosamine dehydrogenase